MAGQVEDELSEENIILCQSYLAREESTLSQEMVRYESCDDILWCVNSAKNSQSNYAPWIRMGLSALQ